MNVDLSPNGEPSQSDKAAVSSAPARSETAERRIFICYSRRMTAEVAEFEETLRECLNSLRPNYSVFRDVTKREGENIPVGRDWRATIDAELDRCVCCVVALIPAIFEQPECVLEIERFQQRVSNGEECFFWTLR
jgi:hypothetical protein